MGKNSGNGNGVCRYVRAISFSVVNITEKLRCCQLDLGWFFLNDWKELFKNKTKLGNNFIYFKES